MSDEMQAAIAAMEARLAMQDARIRAQHDALRLMSLEVAGMRTRLDRFDREMTDASDAMDDIAGDVAELQRARMSGQVVEEGVA